MTQIYKVGISDCRLHELKTNLKIIRVNRIEIKQHSNERYVPSRAEKLRTGS
jgi:hypothetical protein